jgi:hypothetical protein
MFVMPYIMARVCLQEFVLVDVSLTCFVSSDYTCTEV